MWYVAEYEFAAQTGFIKENDNYETYQKYEKYKGILEKGLFYTIITDHAIFTSRMPKRINRDEENNLHGMGLEYHDGVKAPFWHGVPVPEHWITTPEEIGKQEFLEEENSERRRCLHEIIGSDRLTELLDLEIIDTKEVEYQTWDKEAFLHACKHGILSDMLDFTEDKILTEPERILPFYDDYIVIRRQGVILKRTREPIDDGKKASFIEVVCPSKGDRYHLGVPNEFTDAARARAWTLYQDEFSGEVET